MLRKTVINAFVKHNRQIGKVGQYLPSYLIALLGFLLLEGSGLLSSSDSQNDIRSYKYAVLLLMIVKISKIMLILICLSPTLSKPKINSNSSIRHLYFKHKWDYFKELQFINCVIYQLLSI